MQNFDEKIFNRKYLKERRKLLRNNQTPPEKRLWNAIKARKILGYKFRRQHSINNYIVDFYCPEKKLVIEVDGSMHNNQIAYEYDTKRSEYLMSLDLKVIRFSNKDIMNNLDGVILSIEEILNELI